MRLRVMETTDREMNLARPVTAPSSRPSRKRKQRLEARDMFPDEVPLAPRCMLKFPRLDFGMQTMGTFELKRALRRQLHLHSTSAANDTGIDYPNPQELSREGAVTEYQNHRLAAAGWFSKVVRFDSVYDKDYHSALMPAMNVMDRYVTVCVDRREDLGRLLANIGNIRAACLSLALKMYGVYDEVSLEDLYRVDDRVYKALDEHGGDEPHEYVLSDVRGIEEAEKQVIVTLGGAVFPANAENMIGILCGYLLLEYDANGGHTHCGLKDRVTTKAVELFSKTTLDVQLLRFRRWKCIAACCLLAMIGVCSSGPGEGIRLEDSFTALFQELKPGEFTPKELRELKELLTQGCVVCGRGPFVNGHVRDSLRRISSMSCFECMKDVHKAGDD